MEEYIMTVKISTMDETIMDRLKGRLEDFFTKMGKRNAYLVDGDIRYAIGGAITMTGQIILFSFARYYKSTDEYLTADIVEFNDSGISASETAGIAKDTCINLRRFNPKTVSEESIWYNIVSYNHKVPFEKTITHFAYIE